MAIHISDLRWTVGAWAFYFTRWCTARCPSRAVTTTVWWSRSPRASSSYRESARARSASSRNACVWRRRSGPASTTSPNTGGWTWATPTRPWSSTRTCRARPRAQAYRLSATRARPKSARAYRSRSSVDAAPCPPVSTTAVVTIISLCLQQFTEVISFFYLFTKHSLI